MTEVDERRQPYAGVPGEAPPLLSVVVPIFNVEEYLVTCLESLVDQSYPALEVILVDDGSTDTSAGIADEFARGRDHWQVLHVENGGLGRARNIGYDQSTGAYVAFVDSDDIVPRDAYELMMHALVGTGSDLVTGAVLRFDGAKTWNSGLHSRAIVGTALRTHIRRFPSLIYDTTAWNKVYRKAFLEAHGLRFPEGVFYEDIPLTVPAHFLAESVDVIDAPVYLWRERQTAELSITQRRAETRNLLDRMAAVAGVDAFLDRIGDMEGKKLHERKALRIDVPLFVDVIQDGDDVFVRTLVEVCGEFLRSCDQSLIAALPPLRRLQYHLIMQGQEAELRELVEAMRVPANRGKFVRKGVKLYADLPFLGDTSVGVPNSVYEVSRSQPLLTGIRDVWWDGTTLRVEGHAFIHRVSDYGPWSSLHRLQLRRTDAAADERTNLRSRRVKRPDLTGRTTGADVSYDGAGFDVTIPAAALALPPGADAVEYELLAQVATPVAQRGSTVSKAENSRARHPRRALLGPDVLAVPGYRDRNAKLRIAVRRLSALVSGARVDDDELVLDLRPVGGTDLAGAVVHLQRTGAVSGTTAPVREVDGRCETRIPLARLGVSARSVNDRLFAIWLVLPSRGEVLDEGTVTDRVARAGAGAVAAAAGGRPHASRLDGVEPLELDPAVPDITLPVEGRLLVIEPNGLEGTIIRETQPTLTVTSFTWEADGLMLTGLTHGLAASELELVNGNDRHVVPVTSTRDTWTCFVAGFGEPGESVLRWLTPGRWFLVLPTPEVVSRPSVPVRMGSEALDHLGEPGDYGPVSLLIRAGDGRDAQLVVDGGGAWKDRGKRRRERARRYSYRVGRRLPIRDQILFEAWKGSQYSDNPRAVHEELVRQRDPRPMVWAVRDHGVEVPSGVETVLTGTKAYYAQLARSRWLVSNDAMSPAYVKRPGTRYGQTWHGTPLKRIGFDIENLQMSNRNYLVQFAKEKEKWDALVSPNAFSTEIFSRAFRYDGPILEIGYPRNDVFFREAERATRTARVRERLGLEDGRRVVLYAPTWRDNEYDASGRYRFSLKLDLEHLNRELGSDSVVLIRGHQLVAASIDTALFDGFVRNVSSYPDISDLYLVADVLVTDYSSVMFDFVNTGRPMLFYTYDLESYRDKLRGFYFDFEAEAPGPLLTHTTEVADALRSLDQLGQDYAARYSAFRQRFASLEDGFAARRFVDRFLAP